MKIAVFGTGYVGLVTSVCFAEMGHRVEGVDIIASKIQRLNAGDSTIFEPQLAELLQKSLKTGHLLFSTDHSAAIKMADVIYITVGSPADENGSADLRLVTTAVESIAETMTSYKLIVIKSTVPVGTFNTIHKKISEILKSRLINVSFDLVSNPEFLREGSAVEDCLNPDRIVVGTYSEQAIRILKEIYAHSINNKVPFLIMDPNSAELTKYAANSLLAARISLMNEFSILCEKLGADIEMVRQGVGSDHRIGANFLKAGLGYGGSCFPKDVRALEKMGLENHESLPMIKAISQTNQHQRHLFFEKISTRMGDLTGKKIAFWGLSFKPGTDDIREAPSLFLIEQLLQAGCTIQAYDPAANANVRNYFQNKNKIFLFETPDQALNNSDLLIIATEWDEFLKPDFQKMKTQLKQPIIFDGRNIYEPKIMKDLGFEYHPVGRSAQ